MQPTSTATARLQGLAPSTAAAAALAASREARAAERRAARGKEDAFTALSKNAERFSGTLLKAAVMLITIPLGVHMLSHSLMMSLCIRGLEYCVGRWPKQRLPSAYPWRIGLLGRPRSRGPYHQPGGPLHQPELLAGNLPERVAVVLKEFLSTAHHLMGFRSTREALLMSSLVERLERALAAGWLPGNLRDAARQLYLDAHATVRMEMEAVVPGAAAASSGGPGPSSSS
ncbi:hypothetical protein VOLCADRAFT_98665 [Volvox carteri f. nagariensis]|uniref:Uncharacterized protein n=1 Tax=Volvox carteri f. nagariensis TaxID=3068 RepID=D8UFY9_VOLCA|nr:uncharacterized protein VOLCADRAFT_98665 [Volvox carteri f. nagariensis]EFJ41336.1 hypothetical protein VOLCADRAFT_98665 [Volvox carteri f. nagariensis]|eukprot:XP_002957566.1 hypothetical protein VOLCADRAFT_98665 [Volvox carteri f. nagariensis]